MRLLIVLSFGAIIAMLGARACLANADDETVWHQPDGGTYHLRDPHLYHFDGGEPIAVANSLQAWASPGDGGWRFVGNPVFRFANNSKTVVSVSMTTGKVTLGEGVTLDEASKAFWDAVEREHDIRCACSKDGGQ